MVSDEIRAAGRQVCAATGAALPATLNAAIERVVGWPYKVNSGYILDRAGERTQTFASVVYAAASVSPMSDADAIPADNVAAIIDASEDLSSEGLAAAYQRIASAKSLKRSPVPNVGGSLNSTLGVVFAQRSVLSLEALAEELQRWNSQTPNREWPDMVAIATSGALHYAVQFPGQPVGGDYLPPPQEPLNFTPPMYIVMVVRPVGENTFNKMLALLIGHLSAFSPGAKLPEFTKALEGVPQTAIVKTGYQYDLRGELLPVPRHLYADRYLPPLPVRIEDPKGSLLATIQYLPWQDGGVLVLKGKLPLDGLVNCLDRKVLRNPGILRPTPELQISYVMPITPTDFAEMLLRFQRQTRLVVRRPEPKLTIQKLEAEGTASPFMARLLLGLMRLRDVVYGSDRARRAKFDEAFEFVSSTLMSIRTGVEEIASLWEDHSRKVVAGEISRLEGGIIHIDKSIDKELRKEVEAFLNGAVRIIKQGMQNLAAEMQVNIGFMFKQQGAFESGIQAMSATDSLLAEYLKQTRTWSELLVQRRKRC